MKKILPPQVGGCTIFKIVPIGLINALVTFQRLIEMALCGTLQKTCLVYLDNVLILSQMFKDHFHHLEEFFTYSNPVG